MDATPTASPQSSAGPSANPAPSHTATLVGSMEGRYSEGAMALLRILRMACGYWVRFPLAIVSVIAAGVFQLLIPRYLGQAVDHATGLLANGSNAEVQAALWNAALLVVAVAVLRGIFTWGHNHFGEAIGQSLGYELRLAFFEKLQRLSFSYHDRIHSGDLITRGMLDIEGVKRFIDAGVLRVILLAVLIVVGAWMYMGSDPVIGLLCVSFVPFALWRGMVFRLRVRALWRELQER
ncbi:MAG: multidrug transporter, partial [Rhodospirillales bacterium]|nr:multidrug transporter [Rhodospirillales bacterium]